jgi:hypothetical protein
MPAMALGTTTIENIVAHDAAALEKDLAGIKPDAQVALPGVPQIVTRLQQMLSDPNIGIPQLAGAGRARVADGELRRAESDPQESD